MTGSREKSFFLGRQFDPQNNKILVDDVYYDPADLTTHGIVTGMTGSGKTGLCVGMLEEAALKGIPALVIDPKGDLTNLLLHFPDLLPADFEPWLDQDEARRKNKDLKQLSEETAGLWKNGLADWGLGKDDLQALKDSVQFCVYTPGSTSGEPVNILSSFAAPDLAWEEHSEILRERISSTVTGLLALVGMDDIDPLRSREHILLANLLENAWSQGKSMDLIELIMQVQSPPIDRLGAFPMDRFFPENDRFELAMLLNNFLASPSFQTWMEGAALDVEALLYTPSGQPRHSIFYLAHLSENERMFFVTLLFAAVESWMRTKRGTKTLRALIYFDEILGYLPPVKNPPSRPILLRMLKQARAFGVGLLLATQNPVDVDYKALSNAGTWMIGRLQTERDKDRLLDGLTSASGAANRSELDGLISGLGKRVFLLHNVHESKPQIFQTRWALNYLAGPLTRSQIPALNKMTGFTPQAEAEPAAADKEQPRETTKTETGTEKKKSTDNVYSTTAPAVPAGVNEYFLPNSLGVKEASRSLDLSGAVDPEGFIYHPALLAQCQVNYLSRKYKLEQIKQICCLVEGLEAENVRWEDFPWHTLGRSDLQKQALPSSSFDNLPAALSDAGRLKNYEKDFVEWIYREGTIYLKVNEKLQVYAGPDISDEKFAEMCSKAAKDLQEEARQKLEKTFDSKLSTLLEKVTRQEMEIDQQEGELNQRRMEELGTHGELVLSLFSKRRRSVSSSLTKRRMTQQAKMELEQEEKELELMQKKVEDLQKEKTEALADLEKEWQEITAEVTQVPLTPYKKDIFVEYFGIVWMPYYLVRVDDRLREVPAFKSEE